MIRMLVFILAVFVSVPAVANQCQFSCTDESGEYNKTLSAEQKSYCECYVGFMGSLADSVLGDANKESAQENSCLEDKNKYPALSQCGNINISFKKMPAGSSASKLNKIEFDNNGNQNDIESKIAEKLAEKMADKITK